MENNNTYTPPPWSVQPCQADHGATNVIVDSSGDIIAHVFNPGDQVLIAAAPDLLATLKDCVDRMQKCRVLLTRTYPGNWGLLDIWKSLDVINKAEGHDVAKYPLMNAFEQQEKDLRAILKLKYGRHYNLTPFDFNNSQTKTEK